MQHGPQPIDTSGDDAAGRLRAVDAPASTGMRSRIAAHLAVWWPVWVAAICSRIGVAVVGFGAQYAAGQRGIEHGSFLTSGTYGHYAAIAEHGYTLRNAYDYPLLPAIMWAGRELGLSSAITAFALSNIAFTVGLVCMTVLGARIVGDDATMRAATYLALFPFSFAFSQGATEALTLLLLALSVMFAARGSWWAAALTVGLCALARPPAALVILPVAAIAIHRYRSGSLQGASRLAALTTVAAAPASVLAFFVYLKLRTGDMLAAVHAQTQFDRHLSPLGPFRAVAGAIDSVRAHVAGPGIELAVLALAGWAIWRFARSEPDADAPRSQGWRLERAGWVAFAVGSLALPLATGLVWQIPRFLLLVPPVFWAIAVVGRRPWVHQALLVVLPMALALRTVFDVVGAQP